MLTTLRRFIIRLGVCWLSVSSVLPAPAVAEEPYLPEPGRLVAPSGDYIPSYLKGMVVDGQNPFRIEFILDPGHSGISNDADQTQILKQIHYFLSALTIPEEEQWVNLSPYEADRMIPDSLGRTRMGRDLLAQDYLLKQVAASLMYPEEDIGRDFWERVYRRAGRQLRDATGSLETFNKVWVVPHTAVVHEEGGMVLILESRLKVMLESDYLARRNFMQDTDGPVPPGRDDGEPRVTADVLREVIIPELEREVNHGKHFAPLRQMYQAMILATWYKSKLAVSPLHAAYVNRNKTEGIALADETANAQIYKRYVAAFHKGVYNFVKEDFDPDSGARIPRKYFSGGMDMQDRPLEVRQRTRREQLAAVHDGGYLRVGVDVYPAFNPDDGVVGASHDGHGLMFAAMEEQLGRMAERYGWGRIFAKLELQRTAADEKRIEKFFELLVQSGMEHFALLDLQDRIIPVNVHEWRLTGEEDRLGGLIIRHNGVLKILFPRSRLFAPDAEVLGDLLHELTEVTLLEDGMETAQAHALASQINRVVSYTGPDEVEFALRNGVDAVNRLLDVNLGPGNKLPPKRENPLTSEQLTRINGALGDKRARSITHIRRRIKAMRSLQAAIRYLADERVPDGTLRRIHSSTAEMIAQIRDGVLDEIQGPVALFRLTGTDDWVIHKGRTAHKRTKIQLAENLIPGYAYDVYLQNRPGEAGFGLPEPEDLVDFGAEDVDKIHAVISSGGGLTFVDVRGMVSAMSKEQILSMGLTMEQDIRERISRDRSIEHHDTPEGESSRRRALGQELRRMQEQGMIRMEQVAWENVEERLLAPQSFILWDQFMDPSFNIRKRAIALLFHLRDQLGLETVIPIFNAVIDSLTEREQLDLFDHRTYPFSGMFFMGKDASRTLFDVSRYPVVRGVVSLDGWNSRTLWNYAIQQSRLRVMSRELLRRLPDSLRQKIDPMVNDPLIKDGLLIASQLTPTDQRYLGRDFLDAYTEHLKIIGRQRRGEDDPLMAAADELRRRWNLDGIVGAAAVSSDQNPGGIDFHPRWMQMDLTGHPAAPELNAAPLSAPPLSIRGLIPEIYGITPLPTLMPLLGEMPEVPAEKLSRTVRPVPLP